MVTGSMTKRPFRPRSWIIKDILYGERKSLYSYKKWAERNKKGGLAGKIHVDIKDVSHKIRELKKIVLCDEVSISSDEVLKRLNAPDKKPVIPPDPVKKIGNDLKKSH